MKLTPPQRAALQELADGKRRVLDAKKRTLQALYVRGLIESYAYGSGYYDGWKLTKHGKQALATGRVMLSRRREP